MWQMFVKALQEKKYELFTSKFQTQGIFSASPKTSASLNLWMYKLKKKNIPLNVMRGGSPKMNLKGVFQWIIMTDALMVTAASLLRWFIGFI